MPSGATAAQLAPEGAKKKAFRPDIQGLRMVAVVAVIFDHLLHWPSGGFVGVDVFFVISGFLITGLLIREHEKTGTISFTGFYRRRLLRITPAATLVIVFTIVVAFLIFARTRALDTFWDGIWAFLFAANWNMAAQGTDYFQLGGPVSPLQHYWSLAVEEQFYFIWPWLMLLVFWIVARASASKASSARRAAGFVMLAIVLASFAWAMFETANAPIWAYFSTFSRAWELGIGALLAISAGAAAKLPTWSRPVLGWFGLIGIITSFFIVDSGPGFPAPWALLPVLATALVIFAGTGGEQRFMWPLTNPVSGYIGDLSYSLYLWHFPFIIFAISLFGDGTTLYYAVALSGMVTFTVLSYHFFEDPIRRGAWTAEGRRQRRRARRRSLRRSSTRPLTIATACVAAGTLVLSWAALQPRPVPVSEAQVIDSIGAAATPEPTPETPIGILQAEIQAALSASSWPETTPAVASAREAAAPELAGDQQCMHPSNLTDPSICMFGEGDKTAVLLGDSVSVAWMPGIREALEPEGYKVRAIGYGSCPFVMAEVHLPDRPAETERCNNFHQNVIGLLEKIDPEIVILSNNQGGYNALVEGPDAWFDGRRAALEAVGGEGRQVFILEPPPVGKVPEECATPVSTPDNCESEIGRDWKEMVAGDAEAAAAAGATLIDTESWFCANGRCPIFVGDTPVRTDHIHITSTYGQRLAPLIAEALLSAS